METTAAAFFIIFLVTILISRIALLIYPLSSPHFGKFRMHHYMYGLIAVPVAIMTNIFALYAVGVALIVDELAYLLIHGKTHADYRSIRSVVGTIAFIGVVFLLKDFIVIPFA